MNDIETLRAELAELRAACTKMFAFIGACVPGQPTSKAVLKTMLAHRDALQTKGASTLLDEMALKTMMMTSNAALRQHPHDLEVQALFDDLRPGKRQ